MSYKYNLYFAMIFEKEELGHRGRKVAFYFKFCTDNITASTSFCLFKDSKPKPWFIFSLEVPP